MKRIIPMALIALGVAFLVAGGYTIYRGWDARQQVLTELREQEIVTPDDAAIPNTPVRNAATATAMADVIGKHVEERTGGRPYAELGRFVARDGGDTSDEAAALTGPDGQPVENPQRGMAFEASALRTGLYTSVMAINVSELVLGLGLMIAVLGIAFAAIGAVLGGLLRTTGHVDDRIDIVDVEPQPALR